MSTVRRPRLYFSFRSPYSWLTVHRLRAAAPDAFDALDWHPYWDPDEHTTAGLAQRQAEFHYVQMSRAKHLYLLSDTKRLAGELGLTMAWPIDVDPWWELPHLGFLAARRAGRGPQFYDAVIAARWQRGENICTPEVIRAAAVEAGADPDAVVSAPGSPSIRAEGVDSLVTAYEDDVFGIPYLRFGRHRFWGYDRLAMFLQTWRPSAPALRAAGAPQPAAVGAAYDADTAGGCG